MWLTDFKNLINESDLKYYYGVGGTSVCKTYIKICNILSITCLLINNNKHVDVMHHINSS